MDDKKKWIEWRKDGKILVPAASAAEAEPLADQAEAAEALLKSVNDSVGNARTVFATYILLSVHIFLTVGATNDEQLLRDSGIAVPFLSNINLPVSRFYLFVPWMFLFAHVDLLLLFKLMADKLHAFNAELALLPEPEQQELRRQLSGLPFVHWLSGERRDGFSQLITGWVVWTSLFLLPLASLLALQIGFLPYHSAAATFFHKTALGLDVFALWFFWPRLAQRLEQSTWRWWMFGTSAQTVCRGGCHWASSAVLAVSLGSSALLLSLPDSQLENLQDDWALRHWLLDAGAIFHRNLDLHEKLLVANTPELSTLAELQKPPILPGEPDNSAGISLEKRNAALVNIKGLDLQNRDLRFANLSKAKLWKADLRGVKLQHSNLSQAQLAGMLSDGKSQLQGANLVGASLQGADLDYARLQGASLYGVQAGSADFEEADLQGNDIRGMEMTPAYTPADFADWKKNAREGLKKYVKADKLERQEKWLASRVGKDPMFPRQGLIKICLADAKLQTHPSFQSCHTPAKEFFMALADYLGELACSAKSGEEGQPYIALGIARRAT